MTQPTGDEPAPQPRPASPTVRPVRYKGSELDSERGPGLGCFRFQLAVLGVLILATPLTVVAGWPEWVSAALLFVTLALLLVAGQTIIFLLRLVAADRRSRRRPLGSPTRTVGELEDERGDGPPDPPATPTPPTPSGAATTNPETSVPPPALDVAPPPGAQDGDDAVRQ